MNFNNLESEETLQTALVWISEYIQQAIQNKENTVKFTFTANEENSLDNIFEFILKLREQLNKFNFISWCMLSNKNNCITLRVMI